MRSKVVRTLALAFVLSSVGVSLAQQPTPKQKVPPEKSKLEEMLAAALGNNPDIRVADAKLAEADAERNRTRLQVMQKVVALHQAIRTQQAAVDLARKKYERFKGLLNEKAIDPKKSVNARGLVTINVGSDAGLAKGDTLELFRLAFEKPSQSRYLGTIGIIEVTKTEAVGHAAGRLSDKPKPGDRVSSHILGNK